MKLNIAMPGNGTMKVIEVEDEAKLRNFYDKRISEEVPGEALGEEYAGYIFKISGGNDKQGFAMVQGVMLNHRVRLLLSKGAKTYRQRRTGERKRKSVRGCIVGPDLSVLNLVISKKGANELPGLTDVERPRRLGPKRAGKIRRLYNLERGAAVTPFVTTREKVTKKGAGKTIQKRPRVQRLVTPVRLQRKRVYEAAKEAAVKKAQTEAAEYKRLCVQRAAERRASKRSSRRSSRLSGRQSSRRE